MVISHKLAWQGSCKRTDLIDRLVIKGVRLAQKRSITKFITIYVRNELETSNTRLAKRIG